MTLSFLSIVYVTGMPQLLIQEVTTLENRAGFVPRDQLSVKI